MSTSMGIRAETRAWLQSRGALCEACIYQHRIPYFVRLGYEEPVPVFGHHMHEVIRRGNIPKKLQEPLFMRGNSLWLCDKHHRQAHGTDLNEWVFPLLQIVRTPEDLQAFINAYRATFKLDHPSLKVLEWRMTVYADLYKRGCAQEMEEETRPC